MSASRWCRHRSRASHGRQQTILLGFKPIILSRATTWFNGTLQIPTLKGAAAVLIVVQARLEFLHGMEKLQARWAGRVITQGTEMGYFAVSFESVRFFTCTIATAESAVHASKDSGLRVVNRGLLHKELLRELSLHHGKGTNMQLTNVVSLLALKDAVGARTFDQALPISRSGLNQEQPLWEMVFGGFELR